MSYYDPGTVGELLQHHVSPEHRRRFATLFIKKVKRLRLSALIPLSPVPLGDDRVDMDETGDSQSGAPDASSS